MDTLTCRSVALAAWQLTKNRDKWTQVRQSYENDLKHVVRILTTIASQEDAEFAELREALKELHPKFLEEIAGSLTAMAQGSPIDVDMAQFIEAMFTILDPAPPLAAPVPSRPH